MVSTLLLMAAMAFAALCGALGQLAMKQGSTANLTITGILLNPWLWAFAICYGIGVIINFFAYRFGGTVSVLYPIIALSYAFSALFAWKLLGESINGWTITGICVIILGVSIIGWGVTHD
jgi:drug/metabolite transporter (DMT)-like permease